MTDLELAQGLGIADHPEWRRAVASFTPEKRVAYERLLQVGFELTLWEKGLGPLPEGVLIDFAKRGAPR